MIVRFRRALATLVHLPSQRAPLVEYMRGDWDGGSTPSPGADVARGEPSFGADVAGASQVSVQMWQASAQGRCRCGRGKPSPGANGVGGERSPGADVAGALAVPVQMG
jgi:hypothetical protein